jgi:hypothetical protein
MFRQGVVLLIQAIFLPELEGLSDDEPGIIGYFSSFSADNQVCCFSAHSGEVSRDDGNAALQSFFD